MFQFFGKKRRKQENELAPQLTIYERRALESPGVSIGTLPYSTLDQMEKDAMVQTVMGIKKLGVLSIDYHIAPANTSRDAIRNASFIREAIERMKGSPQTILENAMDAFVKGWSIQELVYEEVQGKIWLHTVKPKDPSFFGLEVDAFGKVKSLRLRLPGESDKDLLREKFILYFNRQSYKFPKGRSDLEPAFRHWKAKHALLDAWRVHLERYASPTVLAKYERGLTLEEQAGMLNALEKLQENTAIVFPNEIQVATLGGDRKATSSFQDAIDFHNREIARCVLGQTLTTDEGRRVGTLTLGRVHLQVLLVQLQALRQQLADIIMNEQVIRPLIQLNFGPSNVPIFEFKNAPLPAFETGKI